MVVLVEFVLRASSGGGLPWFVGHECRAGFISLVSQLDSELGSMFHEGSSFSDRRKAVFSLKPLQFISGFEIVFPERSFRRFLIDGNVVFKPGAQATMSVAVLDEGLASRLLYRLLSSVGSLKLSIKGYEFIVEKLSFEIVNLREMIVGEAFEEVDIEFVTPTYFNPIHGDAEYKVLYPDPTLMLASLASTSYQLTGTAYPKPEELASNTYISGLDIKTPMIKEARGEAPTGFVGWVKLRLKEKTDEEIKKKISGLLRLGEITNVGGNRSGGYGVIKLKTKQEDKTRRNEEGKPTKP